MDFIFSYDGIFNLEEYYIWWFDLLLIKLLSLLSGWSIIQELIEKVSKNELPKEDYPCINDPSPSFHGTSLAGPVIQIPPAHSMRSRRTPTWARPRGSDDGYSRFCFLSFVIWVSAMINASNEISWYFSLHSWTRTYDSTLTFNFIFSCLHLAIRCLNMHPVISRRWANEYLYSLLVEQPDLRLE